jgi:hypothetical protein
MTGTPLHLATLDRSETPAPDMPRFLRLEFAFSFLPSLDARSTRP